MISSLGISSLPFSDEIKVQLKNLKQYMLFSCEALAVKRMSYLRMTIKKEMSG